MGKKFLMVLLLILYEIYALSGDKEEDWNNERSKNILYIYPCVSTKEMAKINFSKNHENYEKPFFFQKFINYTQYRDNMSMQYIYFDE